MELADLIKHQIFRRQFLSHYPFGDNLGIELAEGFSAYMGKLNDEKGQRHGGIDYAHFINKDITTKFTVYGSHGGQAFQGQNDSWGTYVMVFDVNMNYRSVYAHLDPFTITKQIPLLPGQPGGSQTLVGLAIEPGFRLGEAGVSGDTKNMPQLHFEVIYKDSETKTYYKLDPYGLYATTGRYPQPGNSLNKLPHLWVTDNPKFGK